MNDPYRDGLYSIPPIYGQITGPMAKEIIDGQLVFHNAPSVEAALRGRLLILEGLQKAERNVLPLLNNLLENREMSLEDGGSDAFGIT